MDRMYYMDPYMMNPYMMDPRMHREMADAYHHVKKAYKIMRRMMRCPYRYMESPMVMDENQK